MRRRRWQVSWNIFKKNKLGMICLGVVLALVVIAISILLSLWLQGSKPFNSESDDVAFALLGTDEYGRDILSTSRIVTAAGFLYLLFGIISQAIALFIEASIACAPCSSSLAAGFTNVVIRSLGRVRNCLYHHRNGAARSFLR